MCCRYYIDKDDAELAEIIESAGQSSLAERFKMELSKPIKTDGEIRPTDVVPVIAPGRSVQKAVFPMKWGFTLPGSKAPLINARVETAAEKPTFKDAWQSRRCILPASWYYEWQKICPHTEIADTSAGFELPQTNPQEFLQQKSPGRKEKTATNT